MLEAPKGKAERSDADAVDLQLGNAAMHRIKRPHLRNKINLTDSAQVRAWRRLGVSADAGGIGDELAARRAAGSDRRRDASSPSLPSGE